MVVQDPIYGRFEIPSRLSRLVLTPEVRRLSQIRLLNTLSPSLATLGELRRYSHTLGVLYLCQNTRQPGYTAAEMEALAASVLLHDIGTPPFGHLMEYHLKETSGWNHEDVIHALLWGRHAPENSAHQIFGGRTLAVKKVLRECRISLELVDAIIQRKHPLSDLLFGSLDLDNLDNVARMAWALGISVSSAAILELAAALTVSRDRVLLLSRHVHVKALKQWARARKEIYDILVFDPLTVATQAVLSEAIGIALSEGLLTESDWTLHDEVLLERLQQHKKTKLLISRDYLGNPPQLVFAIQLDGKLSDYGFRRRTDAKAALDQALDRGCNKNEFLSYVFIDRGTFQKTLRFADPATGKPWSFGITSESVVLYAFARSSHPSKSGRCASLPDQVLNDLGIPKSKVIKLVPSPSKETSDGQSRLAFENI